MQATLYNQNGEKIGKIELSERVFGVKVKSEVLRQVYIAQMANMRQVIAHTKDRSEVRGGGKKPWRQKGTGRARHGSRRSPIWKGGGVTFGPTNERNFKQKINKKVKQKAAVMALSGKVADKELIILDRIDLAASKTKEMAAITEKVVPNFERALLILPDKNENIFRAGRNIDDFKVSHIGNMNIVDLLNYKYLVLTQASVEALDKKYGAV